ncbi:MAG: DNA-binding protein [Alphaproteobacteria bacterium]|nr:DNA-binding protein [Alphaproteobacteria bacterium]
MSEASDEPVRLTEDGRTGDRILFYEGKDGPIAEFRYADRTLWMTQAQIADLFGRDIATISRHIGNILEEGELEEATSLHKLQRSTGRPATLYSLDMIISVGYRVSSKQATLFRRWATDKLVQFATKGFVIHQERLRDEADHDRIRELRDIIRDIRASEANVFREVRKICSLCQDYDGRSQSARDFFAMMQNRLLWAVTSLTAPEIILGRANAGIENMGLTNWPKTDIRKQDVIVAHNYLGDSEIREKNRLTVMLLDFFEDRLDQGRLTTMAAAAAKLAEFLRFNERPVLEHKGSVTREEANRHAEAQYEEFAERRRALRQETPDG